MKKLLTFLTSIALLIANPAPAQRSDDATSKTDPRLEKWLKQYPEADADKNGILTMTEARAYQKKLQDKRGEGKKQRVAPTHADVKYGDHERNVFDLWIPESKDGSADGKPFPILVFFHGGGFVAGDKSGFDPQPYLDAGIAAASGNYRFVDGAKTFSPVPMQDAARAIQTIRHRAEEWNLDPERIAVSGSSAGAVITMWIGYRDDLADPESDDPVARQSTRVHTIIPLNGPTNVDPVWIRKNLGGPHHVHGSVPKMYGQSPSDEFSEPEIRKRIDESNPWNFLTADDPATLMIYGGGMDEMPLPESVSTGKLIHHPFFGKKLKERLDELGIENGWFHATDPRGKPTVVDYLKGRFGISPDG